MTDVTHYTGKDDPDFTAFMKRVDRVVANHAAGLGVFDFADVCWRDLFDAGDVTDEEICECLADGDFIFAELYALYQISAG